jgi:hypothetical protein
MEEKNTLIILLVLGIILYAYTKQSYQDYRIVFLILLIMAVYLYQYHLSGKKEHLDLFDKKILQDNVNKMFSGAGKTMSDKLLTFQINPVSMIENLDPTGTVAFVLNTVPGARDVLKIADSTAQYAGALTHTVADIVSGTAKGAEKIFKDGDVIGGIKDIGAGTINGITTGAKLTGDFIVSQANNIKDGIVNVGNDIKNGIVNVGNSIKCAFGGCKQTSGTPGGQAREYTDGYNYCIDGMGGGTPGYNECDSTGGKKHRDWENWSLDHIGRISNNKVGKCLDGGGVFSDCQERNGGQQWTVLKINGKGSMIVNNGTGQCLDGGKSPPYLNKCDANNNWMSQWRIGRFHSRKEPNLEWMRYPASDDYSDTIIPSTKPSEIKTVKGGKCIDVDGEKVQIYNCHGQANQLFVYETSKKRIKTMWNKCFDVPTDGNKVDVRVKDCHGGSNQKWTFNGHTIRSDWNNKCIDIRNGNFNNSTILQMYDCHGGENQDFNYWFF